MGRLRFGDYEFAVESALERPNDADSAAIEIDIAPPKSEEFAASHARTDRDRNDRFERPPSCGVEEYPYLIRVEDDHLEAPNPWRIDEISDVARHEVPAHRLAERGVKHRVEVVH